MMRPRTDTESITTRVVALATVALLLPSLIVSVASAATYHVSTTGSDSNPGTLSQPFLTISKGLSVMTAGDTLRIRQGTYAEFITSVPSGTSYANAPVISAYPGETVTLAPSGSLLASVIDLAGPFHHVIFQNLRIDAAGVGYGGQVSRGGHHIRFQGVEIFNAGQNGFLLPNLSTTTSTFIEFLNCNVHDNGFLLIDGKYGHGLYIETSDNLVEGCAVHHNGAYGIHIFSGSAGVASNNTVRANDAHDNSRGTPTIGAGILLSSGDNNVAYNNITRGNAYGIIVGFGSVNSNMKAYNNTIYRNSLDGILVTVDSSSAQLRNNILWANGNAMSNSGSGTVMSNNLLTNPMFLNEGGGDFHLLSTSPAINAGMTLGAVPTDKDGLTRSQGGAFDIGAYEFLTGDTTRSEESAATPSPASAWVTRGSEIATFIGGTAVSSEAAGATSTFSFTGTAVSWHGLKCNLCGVASVSIDGGVATTVDTAGPTAPGAPGLTSEVVFTSPPLSAGSHTVMITVTGTTSSGGAHIAVDAFDVRGESPGSDTAPPEVAITSPKSGTTVFGTMTVTANASDNVGVMGVQLRLDSDNLGTETTTAPYQRTWDTTATAQGTHTLTATARDAAGNTRTASVTVTVSNPPPPDNTPPTVTITSPANTETVNGTINVTADASDNVDVVAVEFRLDGAAPGTEDTANPYSVRWNTEDTADGFHTLTATARDAAGNTGTASITVRVSNDTIAPTVTITSPANGTPVSGTTPVAADASDNKGVVAVEFRLDGATPGTEVATPPYSVSWDTTTTTDGPHTLTAVARDEAGNTHTASVTVTVANDTTPPAVSINQATDQADPTNASPINFTAVFSEPVSGFTDADVTIAGTAGGTKTVVVTGGPSTYIVAVSGMTDGTVSATIPAGVAQDAAGNANAASTTTDNTVTFAPPDATAPTVTINQAAGQAEPTSTTPINFTAVFREPVSGFTGADVVISGTAGGTKTVAVSGGPSTYTVTVSGMTDGTVSATIPAGVAQDAAGNANTASTSTDNTVTFDTTAPTVTITSPASGSTVRGTIAVSADASDNVGVVAVEFRLDGATPGTEVATPPYSVSWDTTTTSDGSHTLTAVARDEAGNTRMASVTVTASNAPPPDATPPTVTITSPASGSTVSGTIPVSADASDDVGVIGVQFRLDGAPLGPEVTAAPYSVTWDTTPAGNGSTHTLSATARDAAGNTSTASVTVTVSNPPPP
jgi:parallel beta-helix repeat protein